MADDQAATVSTASAVPVGVPALASAADVRAAMLAEFNTLPPDQKKRLVYFLTVGDQFMVEELVALANAQLDKSPFGKMAEGVADGLIRSAGNALIAQLPKV